MTLPPGAPLVIPRREVIKVTIASLVGTTLEFYDFLLFGFVAPVFAVLFFPSSNPVASLLATFAAFAVGFIGRPVGAMLFGHLGDRIGRRYTLVVTMVLMGVVSLATALLPSYQQVGLLAPILLVILRLFAGLSLGGELGGGTTITAEFVSKERRGLWLGIIFVAIGAGPLIATSSVAVLSSMMGAGGFAATGWRWLFGAGALIAVFGLLIRFGISESPIFQKQKERSAAVKIPAFEVFTKYWKTLLMGIGFSISGAVTAQLFGAFAVSYMTLVSKVSLGTASLVSSAGFVSAILSSVIAGYLADRFGRRVVLIAAGLVNLAFIYPYFLVLSSSVVALMIVAQVLAWGFQSMYIAQLILQPELFPTRARVTGMSLIYQLNVAIFGGTTPLIATYLISLTDWRLAPIIWGFAAIAISLAVTLLIKETRGIDLTTIK